MLSRRVGEIDLLSLTDIRYTLVVVVDLFNIKMCLYAHNMYIQKDIEDIRITQ